MAEMAKVIGVNIYGNNSGDVTLVLASYDNDTMRKYSADNVPRTVYDFCVKAKNKEGIELSNGRIMTAYFN